MNRIVIILVTLCLVLCSGCIEIGYKSEVNLSLFKQEDTRPRIVRTKPKVNYDYPTQKVNDEKYIELEEKIKRLEKQQIQDVLKTKPETSFAKFNN